MRKAIVKVTVLVELDIDTDRDVTAIEYSVLNRVRCTVEDTLNSALENDQMGINSLGHYIDTIAVPFAQLDK